MGDSSSHSNSRNPVECVKPHRFGDHMLGVSQVAKMLGMSPRTIRYLAALADLPGVKVGRAWRFWRSEILQYLEDHRGDNLLG